MNSKKISLGMLGMVVLFFGIIVPLEAQSAPWEDGMQWIMQDRRTSWKFESNTVEYNNRNLDPVIRRGVIKLVSNTQFEVEFTEGIYLSGGSWRTYGPVTEKYSFQVNGNDIILKMLDDAGQPTGNEMRGSMHARPRRDARTGLNNMETF
ncbi:MAG: hypothetical protein LBJ31_07670 [Treponema sp.]|jgi:hypothetical protein|nr:hypothetical protein [Treponema sp.]